MCTRPERHSADASSWDTDQCVYTQAKRLNNFEKYDTVHYASSWDTDQCVYTQAKRLNNSEKYDTVHFLIKPSKSDNNFKRLINLTIRHSTVPAKLSRRFQIYVAKFGDEFVRICNERSITPLKLLKFRTILFYSANKLQKIG